MATNTDVFVPPLLACSPETCRTITAADGVTLPADVIDDAQWFGRLFPAFITDRLRPGEANPRFLQVDDIVRVYARSDPNAPRSNWSVAQVKREPGVFGALVEVRLSRIPPTRAAMQMALERQRQRRSEA